MSKYDPLGAFLLAQPMSSIPMTFEEIERVIGFSLPPVAKTARAWWSNNPSNNVMTKVWTAAGFRSEQVDIAAETLVFRRDATERLGGEPNPRRTGRSHPALGCLKGVMTFAPDLDLSAPADPSWSQATR